MTPRTISRPTWPCVQSQHVVLPVLLDTIFALILAFPALAEIGDSKRPAIAKAVIISPTHPLSYAPSYSPPLQRTTRLHSTPPQTTVLVQTRHVICRDLHSSIYMRNRKQPSCSRKQNGPRKRTGCATCKGEYSESEDIAILTKDLDAHVKCTEEKPECRRCERLSLSCQYEFKLLWEEDALQRNIVHGRSGVWSRHGRPPILPPTRVQVDVQESNHQPTGNSSSLGWHFISYNQQDFVDGVPFSLLDDHLEDNEAFVNLDKDGSNGLQDENQVSLVSPQQMLTRMTCALALGILEVGGAVSTGTSLTNWIPTKDGTMDETLVLPYPHSIPLIGFSSSDSQLFSYYVQELSPKCSLSSHRNPYLNVLLPVAYSFEPLRHTLLAAAACQLFHYSGNRHFELQSLRHRSKAMRGLNEHLGKEDMDWSSLATMVMFCFRDITDGCEPSWITHLKMGLRMLKRIRATIKADANLRSFCEIYFVAHDVMGRAAWEHDVSEMQHYEWEQDECYQEVGERPDSRGFDANCFRLTQLWAVLVSLYHSSVRYPT